MILALLSPHYDWRYVIASYLPVAINATYVCLTIAITRYTIRAARASEASAKAAADSAAAQRESLTVTQRAYIAFTGLEEVELPTLPSLDVHFRVQIKNVGNTSAMRGWLRTEIQLSEQDYSAEHLPSLKSKPNSDLTVGPQEPLRTDVFYHFRHSDYTLFTEYKRKLYIVGEFRYEDVFGTAHITKFCVNYSPLGFNTTPFYNEMS